MFKEPLLKELLKKLVIKLTIKLQELPDFWPLKELEEKEQEDNKNYKLLKQINKNYKTIKNN